jgi:hypothetical protein
MAASAAGLVKRRAKLAKLLGTMAADDSGSGGGGGGGGAAGRGGGLGGRLRRLWLRWRRRHCAPDSQFRLWWLALCILGCGYYAAAVPLRLACTLAHGGVWPGGAGTAAGCADALVDALFAADVVLHCRYFGFKREGVAVMDARRIAARYWADRRWVADWLAALPADWLALAVAYGLQQQQQQQAGKQGGGGGGAGGGGGGILRVVPFLRLARLLRLTRSVGYVRAAEAAVVASGRTTVGTPTRRLVKMFALVGLAVHWVGCGWYLLAVQHRLPASSLPGMGGFEVDWATVDNQKLGSSDVDHSAGEGAAGYLR